MSEPSSPMIAALYCDPRGCYAGLDNIDLWDEARDARLYDGPWPVIAHPPCERWGRYATANDNRPGDDNECFAAALAAVRRYGGIIEHPANSLAWKHFRIPHPDPAGGWLITSEGWTCHVEQGWYGHRARKATWLLLCRRDVPPPLIWGPAPQRLPAKRLAERGYESARRCGMIGNMGSAERRRTPTAFRDLLISLL